MVDVTEMSKNERIAKVCHEVNRGLCLAMGDDSHVSWEAAPEWQRESSMAGVEMHLANLDATPAESHEAWMLQKAEDGWVLGEKDEDAKTHPLMVPYHDLPAEQRAKDYAFKAVVAAMASLPGDDAEVLKEEVIALKKELAAGPPAGSANVPGKVPVKYIGKREVYTDGLYKTGITFEKGKTEMVNADKAALLLKHPDQYVRGEVEEAPTAEVVPPEEMDRSDKDDNDDEESRVQDAKDAVMNMRDADAVREYVKVNFSGAKLHHNLGLDKAKAKAIGLIGQFGLVD